MSCKIENILEQVELFGLTSILSAILSADLAAAPIYSASEVSRVQILLQD
jgi:hypothetical protein